MLFNKNLLEIVPGLYLPSPSRSLIGNLSLPQDPDDQPWTTDRLQQMLVEPEEHNAWVAEFEVDLGHSRESAEPVMRMVRLGSLT